MFFNPSILEVYKSEPDKYEILFDDFEGILTTRESYFLELEKIGRTENYINIRFGRIKLQNGDATLIIWVPDLLNCSKEHKDRWLGFIIQKPIISLQDENFTKWYKRNIEALFVKNGVLYELAETVKKINEYTNKTFRSPLYTNEIGLTVPFPNAENTHRYQDSHQELYRYLLDGLNRNCIDIIATKLNCNIQSGHKTTFNTLLKIFPQLKSSKFKAAMENVSKQRRLAGHQVRDPAENFKAFEKFKSDLIDCNDGLNELLQLLKMTD